MNTNFFFFFSFGHKCATFRLFQKEQIKIYPFLKNNEKPQCICLQFEYKLNWLITSLDILCHSLWKKRMNLLCVCERELIFFFICFFLFLFHKHFDTFGTYVFGMLGGQRKLKTLRYNLNNHFFFFLPMLQKTHTKHFHENIDMSEHCHKKKNKRKQDSHSKSKVLSPHNSLFRHTTQIEGSISFISLDPLLLN